MGQPTPAAPRPSQVLKLHRATWATPLLVLLAAVALAGCGTGATETNALAPKEPTRLNFTSSAIHGTALPALYTCDGKNTWPPVSWGKVPASVEELALFAVGTRRLSNGRAEVSVDWALAGLNPSLHGVRAGEIPRGAFLVANSKGEKRYSVCPPRGQTEHYSFALLALPRYARAARGFPGPDLLQNLTGTDVEYEAPAVGTFSVKYTRR
jgi:phosphatidylethanolamine-binding protein (PEBP) family uncharacterized protein